MCLLRARCLQQTGTQLGNAANGCDEQLWGRGWSLAVSRHDSAHIALIYFPLRKVHVVGFAPQGPSAAAGAAPWDAGAECTGHLTWCPPSRDLPKATLTLPPSPCPAGNETWSPSKGRRKGRWQGQRQEKGGSWGLLQTCTPTPTLDRDCLP